MYRKSKKKILTEVWGTFSMVEPSTLAIHIRWFREKIEENPTEPEYTGFNGTGAGGIKGWVRIAGDGVPGEDVGGWDLAVVRALCVRFLNGLEVVVSLKIS